MYWQNKQTQKANWSMMENLARFITEKAEKLIEEGDIYTAARLLLNVLPENLVNPNRPYIKEAEYALRKANDIYHSSKFQFVNILKHDDDVRTASFSPDGKFIITASYDKTAKIWNSETGKQVGETLKHDEGVNSASFSPNGKFIVTASDDNTARIWNAETGTMVRELKHHGFVNSASFSPDGKFIVTASSDYTARIWNAGTGKQVGETLKHGDYVSSVSFSPDGKFIVTASYDNTARIWNAETGKQVGEMTTAYLASFSPNGEYLLTVSGDGTAKITESIPLQDFIDKYKDLFKDWPLTEKELKEYNLK